jgi:hypothetical protein
MAFFELALGLDDLCPLTVLFVVIGIPALSSSTMDRNRGAWNGK